MYVVQQAGRTPAMSAHRALAEVRGQLNTSTRLWPGTRGKTRTRTRSSATYIGQSTKQKTRPVKTPHKLCK